jgi:tRNA threonylcarbamoyladenosine biosynthesis protein TsaB
MAASGACMRLLEIGLREAGVSLGKASLIVADLGPGSFTGVRVGVTLAKTLAYTQGTKTAGSGAFDLIDPLETVVVPSKRGEWFVRIPGGESERSTDLPQGAYLGYGQGIDTQTYPDAARFAPLLRNLVARSPEELTPLYLSEPSISTPKKPYGAGVAQ